MTVSIHPRAAAFNRKPMPAVEDRSGALNLVPSPVALVKEPGSGLVRQPGLWLWYEPGLSAAALIELTDAFRWCWERLPADVTRDILSRPLRVELAALVPGEPKAWGQHFPATSFRPDKPARQSW